MENPSSNKRFRFDSPDSESESPEVKRLKADLLDDSDPDPTVQDLDSVIQSFADEISPVSSPPPLLPPDSLPELGYLLFASDDELGLPPSDSSTSHAGETEVVELARASSGIGEIWGFEDASLSYESFELGEGERFFNEPEYVAFDGLFEHSDVYSVFS